MTSSQEDNPTKYVGPHEVAMLLGVSRQRIYQLASRPTFPRPIATLAIGRVWLAADIRQWDAARKKESGPPAHRRRA